MAASAVVLDPERIVKRLHSLVLLYKKLPPHFVKSYLNQLLLKHCIESYFQDLERTKIYHDIPRGDGYKKAAFTIKWIARTKPIQLYEGDRVTKELTLINEVFAIYAGLSFLNLGDAAISVDYMENLMYTVHYRPLDEGVLTSKMYLLECAALRKSP